MKGCAHVTRKQEHDWDHLFIHSIYQGFSKGGTLVDFMAQFIVSID